jgi:hypothetical protein
VLGRNKKVLLDTDASGNVLYLPLDQLGTGSGASRNVMPPIITPDANDNNSTGPAGRTSRREARQ